MQTLSLVFQILVENAKQCGHMSQLDVIGNGLDGNYQWNVIDRRHHPRPVSLSLWHITNAVIVTTNKLQNKRPSTG